MCTAVRIVAFRYCIVIVIIIIIMTIIVIFNTNTRAVRCDSLYSFTVYYYYYYYYYLSNFEDKEIQNYYNFISFLYGCEIWSLTLREERRLRVFESRVLRRTFGPKRDEVTREWRKLHSEELSDLYLLG